MIDLFREYLPKYRWPLVFVLVLLSIQAIANLFLPELNADIINNGVVKGDIPYILRTGGFMLLVTGILGVAAVIGVYFSAKTSMAFGRDVRSGIFRKVETFSQVEVNTFGAASLITRNTNDVQQVQQVLLLALTQMISAPILVVGGLIMALRQDVPLSGVLLVIIPIMVALIGTVMYKAIPLFRALQKKIDRINLVMRETLAGVRVIRAFVRTRDEEARFDEASLDLMDTGLRVNRLFAITIPALMAIMNLSHGRRPVAGRLPREQRRDADRQPDRVPPVHLADPVLDHDRGHPVRHGPARPGVRRPDQGGPRDRARRSGTRPRRSPRSAAAASSSATSSSATRAPRSRSCARSRSRRTRARPPPSSGPRAAASPR